MQPASDTQATTPPVHAKAMESLYAAQLEADPAALRRLARDVRVAVLSPDMERAALNRQRPCAQRLAELSELQRELRITNLPSRERGEISEDIDRLGLRILNSERIVAQILESPLPAAERAAALLTMLYRGMAPGETSTRLVLDHTHALLASKEGREALSASPSLRVQIEGLFMALHKG